MGVPIGWTPERIGAAKMWDWVWTCTKLPDDATYSFWPVWRTCKADTKDGEKIISYKKVWFQVPTVLSVWFYLFLGGLLVGLGAPFWYNAVTGLTNIRNVARDVTGANAAQTRAARI